MCTLTVITLLNGIISLYLIKKNKEKIRNIIEKILLSNSYVCWLNNQKEIKTEILSSKVISDYFFLVDKIKCKHYYYPTMKSKVIYSLNEAIKKNFPDVYIADRISELDTILLEKEIQKEIEKLRKI